MIVNKIKVIGAAVLATTMLLGGTVSASVVDMKKVKDPRPYATEIQMNKKYIIDTQNTSYSESRYEYVFKYTPSETGAYTFLFDDYDSNRNYGYLEVYEDDVVVPMREIRVAYSSCSRVKVVLTQGHTYYFLSDNGSVYFSFILTGYVKTGWNKIDGEWYFYHDDYSNAYGLEAIGGSTYFFSSTGRMYTGWVLYQGSYWYYCGSDGKVRNGWQKINNEWYYFGTDYEMCRGLTLVGDHYYYFDTDGHMLKNTWIDSYNGYMYADENGYVVYNGWKKIGSEWYFFRNGSILSNYLFYIINGDTYSFDKDGHMRVGWFADENWHYADSDGRVASGWKKINGYWYYFYENFNMCKDGWHSIDGVYYYFLSSGEMASGWQKIDENWYYFESNGIRVTGWKQIQGKQYYFSETGVMYKGWHQIYGDWYYFGTDGVMATGWKQLSGVWYYFFDSGRMLAGAKYNIGGTTYTFDSNGHLVENA